MTIDYNKIKVRIDLSAIEHNYKLLSGKGANLIPVVKADAYGHGLLEVAGRLYAAGARSFAVGSLEEGAKLRLILPEARIISLLGLLEAADIDLARNLKLIPFVHDFTQLEQLSRQIGESEIEIALKFDTGMSRLGFSESDLPLLAEKLKQSPGLKPVMLSTHLATSDMPGHWDYMRGQAEVFSRINQTLRASGFRLEANLANSAAILSQPDLYFDTQRLGISLYGANPYHGTSLEPLGDGLRQAMRVSTIVVTMRKLSPGQSISYGCTFTANNPMRAAIVAAGYADGYSRSLSNKACVLINGQRAPLIGRVCMQLSAVDVSHIEGVKPGSEVCLLGGQEGGFIGADELASWAGTISYELFCLLGLNRREYV